jgi:hypothetical protein
MDILFNYELIGSIITLLILVCTSIIYFREPIKALISSISFKSKNDKESGDYVTQQHDKSKPDMTTEFQLLSSKLTDLTHTISTNKIEIINSLDNLSADLSSLIRDIKNDTLEVRSEHKSINYKLDTICGDVMLNKDHLYQLIAKLDSCNVSLIELSLISKRNAGF